MKVAILGMGQVGSSVLEVYRRYNLKHEPITIYGIDTFSKDIKSFEGFNGVIKLEELKETSLDMVHVCIPFEQYQQFKEYILELCKVVCCNMVLIHSTVDTGVTARVYNALYKETNNINIKVAHSPVMGVHPNLADSMLTFRKIVGGVNQESADAAIEHLNMIGIKTEIYESSNDSEAAKLFSTSYYGSAIMYEKEVYRFCKENNLNFDDVYGKTNDIYNEGFAKMEMPNVRRPILKQIDGKISGHCVRQNWEIIQDKFPLAKIGVEYDATL